MAIDESPQDSTEAATREYREYLQRMKEAWAEFDVDSVELSPGPAATPAATPAASWDPANWGPPASWDPATTWGPAANWSPPLG